ncbi:MAG: Gfo/Idh/MocA family oxidoreductase [Candidatus Solibacter usitatus]|nr:Gfo/Idh/MocA family oxidoreductase [Candidatus Solibacter usitatus]
MRIAVVGLGFMGMVHLKAIRNISRHSLAAVVSEDPVKLSGDLSAIAGNLGGPGEKMDFSTIGRYKNVDELLKDPKVDAVDLCLPTHLHEPVTLAALRAGKHVLVEKPMGIDGASCDRMIAEAEKQGRTLMVAQVLRFFPAYIALRDALPQLGAVRSAMFRRRCAGPAWAKWLVDKSKSGGGVFDLVIHDADQVIQHFGLPAEISATGHEDLSRGVDVMDSQLYYANGLVVTITGGWHHPKSYPFSMEYTVVCDGGTVEYSSAGREPALHRANGESEILPLPATDGYQGEIEYFLDCAESGRKPELCSPQDSAAAVRLTKLLEQSRSRNGEKVACRF